jgi:hypothetical protein
MLTISELAFAFCEFNDYSIKAHNSNTQEEWTMELCKERKRDQDGVISAPYVVINRRKM